MRIGLLRVGHIDPRSQHVGGDYRELYASILGPHGIELVEFQCDEGDLPASLGDCNGWLCSPSRSSVYDDEPWLDGVTELLLRLVAEERPFVGICFGHQLLAQALGGEVRKADTGWGVGVQDYEVLVTPWWMDQPRGRLSLIASHQDQVVALPPDATLLAGNDECPLAGMLVGERAWTLQGHPEFTADLADSLLAGRIQLIGAEKVAAARATLSRPADQAHVAAWMARSFGQVLRPGPSPAVRRSLVVVSGTAAPVLPDGLVAVVKHDCPTCTLVRPLLAELGAFVVSEDDDNGLVTSYQLGIETVPTLLKVEGGAERDRTVGWSRAQWEALAGVGGLAPDLPESRPGCGSRTLDPTVADELAVRFEGHRLRSRRVDLSALEDEAEAMFDRGWTDGLPVVAPTEVRVLRMLAGTTRDPQEVVAVVPPDLIECTVEKVAINAVLAGCRPEYLPVVLAAVEAACTDEFNAHGVLATTMPVGPVLIVNGPVRRRIGMNSGVNALGQGNRANSTIGRALQLVIRNVGGGRPGGVDRAAHGNPGKVGLCFAEDEEGSPFDPLHVSRGFDAPASTVTVFAGEGPRGVVDQLSRDPESLARSLAECLRTVQHPKLPLVFDAVLVVGPEHGRVFHDAGWSRPQLLTRLDELLQLAGADIVRGAGGISEGIPEQLRDATLPKFRPGGIVLVHAGGGAGLFSTIIAGWANGATGSQPTTREVST